MAPVDLDGFLAMVVKLEGHQLELILRELTFIRNEIKNMSKVDQDATKLILSLASQVSDLAKNQISPQDAADAAALQAAIDSTTTPVTPAATTTSTPPPVPSA